MDDVSDQINCYVQLVHHCCILIWHVQQRSHERIDWLPNQLRKSICNESDPIWGVLVMICKAEPIIPLDFIKMSGTEMDDWHHVVIDASLGIQVFARPQGSQRFKVVVGW